MTSAITREEPLSLFPLEPLEEKAPSSRTCPVCGSRYLFDDADPELLSCFRCSTWLRRGPGGVLIRTSVPLVDTAALPLPWRKAKA